MMRCSVNDKTSDTDFDRDFLLGQIACQQGEAHKSEWSEAMTRGYQVEYQREQNQEAMSREQV